MEFFSFWKNICTPQPDSNVNFGPNECSSRGGTNQGLCVIHGMCVVDFFHVYIFSKWCSHMPTQVSACTLILGCKFVNTISVCLLSSPWALKNHLMLRGVGGMAALLPVVFGHETQLWLIFIKYFPSCTITFTYVCFSYNPETYITLSQF